jgi:hypothetical protein
MSVDASQAETILDHLDQIRVPGVVFSQPNNEYWALLWQWDGLESLHRLASQCDEVVRQRLNPEGKLQITSFGNLPEMALIPQRLLTCAFHWYAITACQYVRTVGAIACRADATRPFPPEYVKRVIPDVLSFRDKVAAHFAWCTRNGKDSEAERLASILPQLSFVNDAFHVGAMTISVTSGGKQSDSSAILPWSIAGVHRRLRERYHPELCAQ